MLSVLASRRDGHFVELRSTSMIASDTLPWLRHRKLTNVIVLLWRHDSAIVTSRGLHRSVQTKTQRGRLRIRSGFAGDLHKWYGLKQEYKALGSIDWMSWWRLVTELKSAFFRSDDIATVLTCCL